MSAKVHAALVAAQTELHNPKKDATADTGRFSYSYATLATVLDLVRPVLAKHGLAVAQDVRMSEGGGVAVYTLLAHTSGEQLLFGPILGKSGGDWQQLGSAVTYARRYSLMAALGLAAEDEDDDGNQAVGSKAKVTTKEKPVERVKAADIDPSQDPWATPEVPPALEGLVADEAPIQVPNDITGPLRKTWGQDPATDKQRGAISGVAKRLGYESAAAFLDSQEVRELLGGTCSSPIKKGHAAPILDKYLGARS